MKIDRDDPRWTTFALGEMNAEEQAAFECAIEGDADAETYLAELRSTSALLQASLQGELDFQTIGKRPVVAMPTPLWQRDWVWNASVAALFTVCLGALLMMLQSNPTPLAQEPNDDLRIVTQTPEMRIHLRQDPQAPALLAKAPQALRSPLPLATWVSVEPEYLDVPANLRGDPSFAGTPFRDALHDGAVALPSSEAIEQFAMVAQALEENRLPDAGSIRVGELVAAVAQPASAGEIDVEVAACPWAPAHQLVWIRAPLKSSSVPAQIQVNTRSVSDYRMLGSSMMGSPESPQWVALLEVKPLPGSDEDELMRFRLAQGGVEMPVHRPDRLSALDADMRLVSAAAAFGLRLQGETTFSFENVARLAESALGESPAVAHQQFAEIARRAANVERRF